MDTSTPAPDSKRRRFRIAVLTASVAAAVIGSTLLVLRDSGEKTTTVGVTATLPVAGHPGAVVADQHELWVALSGDPDRAADDQPLILLDTATGAVTQSVYLGGEVSHLAHAGGRLVASVQHASGLGQLAVLNWRNGAVLDRHWYDRPIEQIVFHGNALWALEERPGTLLQLDPATLAQVSTPIRLSPGRVLALASGGGYLWATAADTGELLRVDPATRAIKRVPVGGSPIGIVFAGGSVWFADQAGGKVVRLDPRSLRRVGKPIRVGKKPSWLAAAGGSIFVTDQDGTVTRMDVGSGKKVGLPIRITRPAKDTPAPMLASAGQSVWVSNPASNTLSRINSIAGRDNNGGDELAVRIAHMNAGGKGDSVTNGGLAGIGDFTASGAIAEKGKVFVYRTVKMPRITLRYVAIGKKGTITFVVKIETNVNTSQWTIASATKGYAGLHGEGIEREDVHNTVSTLTGTLTR